MKRHKPDIEITELILAKADWKRTFIGTIDRFSKDDGSQFVVGKVTVNQCQIISQASNDDELRRFLDDMVILILDYKLFDNPKMKSAGTNTDFFHN